MPAPDSTAPVVVVVGALAPYTQVLYEMLARRLSRPLRILACSARETARQWQLDEAHGYAFEVLPGLRWHRSSISNLYVNPSVVPRIMALKPAALVLNDFAPTMAMAAMLARARGIPFGVRTDGVPETDPGARSLPHRLMRRAVIRDARFGLGPSQGSRRLLEAYGLPGERFRVAPLFPAWRAPAEDGPARARPYDVLFCGALNDEVKGARFFTDVVLACLDRGRRLTVRVAGDGPLRADMERRFAEAGIAARFDGFLPQAVLAEAYGSAKLFHFPSRGDVWGIVVQEAMQCGTVVIASPHAGVARELVAQHRCGLVLDLDRDAWADATIDLLDHPDKREAFRSAANETLADFAPEKAAEAYAAALECVLG